MKSVLTYCLQSVMLVLAVMLICVPGRASTANCPTEPTQTSITPGEVYAGSNCNLNTDGDVDSFTFNGTSGDTYQIMAALNGAATQICVTLYDPSLNEVNSQCTSAPPQYSAGFTQKLTATGTYYIDVTEISSVKQNYALSLEQFFPFPSYATQIPNTGESLSADITPITDANLFTLSTADTGKYLWTATLPSNASSQLCIYVYFSNFASAGSACTSAPPTYTAQVEYQPTAAEAGRNMAVVEVYGNDGVQTYNLEVSCVAGNCPHIYPPCTLNDTLNYNATDSTLTMDFTVGTNTAATWNAWLTYGSTIESLFSVAQKVTVPPVSITKTKTGLAKEGTVGVLSTLTTTTQGITCSNFATYNTGTP
jgi:hypothetical protein